MTELAQLHVTAPSDESTSPRLVSTGVATTVILGINRFIGLRASSKPENPHGLSVRAADQSEMHGVLHKQGSRINSWHERYFVLQGTTIAHWDDEEAARAADPAGCHDVGMVRSVRRWQAEGGRKPAHIAEKTWMRHAAYGFSFATDEREFSVYAEAASVADQWVRQLEAAVAQREGEQAVLEDECRSQRGATAAGGESGKVLSRLYEQAEQLAYEALSGESEETDVGDIRRQVMRRVVHRVSTGYLSAMLDLLSQYYIFLHSLPL
jgi:hypothetical protein